MQDDNDDTKMFYVFLAVQFLDIYTKTFTHIYNRYSLLTIQYNYYLLFIKWRGIIVKVFVVAFFTLSRLRKRGKRWGQSCCLSNGRSERGGAGGREGERGNISGNKTSWKYILISVCFFCLFSFLKKCVYVGSILPPFAFIPVPVSQKGQCRKRSQRQC